MRCSVLHLNLNPRMQNPAQLTRIPGKKQLSVRFSMVANRVVQSLGEGGNWGEERGCGAIPFVRGGFVRDMDEVIELY